MKVKKCFKENLIVTIKKVTERILDKHCSSFLVYDYGFNQICQQKPRTEVGLPRKDLGHTLLPNNYISSKATLLIYGDFTVVSLLAIQTLEPGGT